MNPKECSLRGKWCHLLYTKTVFVQIQLDLRRPGIVNYKKKIPSTPKIPPKTPPFDICRNWWWSKTKGKSEKTSWLYWVADSFLHHCLGLDDGACCGNSRRILKTMELACLKSRRIVRCLACQSSKQRSCVICWLSKCWGWLNYILFNANTICCIHILLIYQKTKTADPVYLLNSLFNWTETAHFIILCTSLFREGNKHKQT